MKTGTFIAITLACFAACFAAGFLVGQKRANRAISDHFRTDTVTCTIHDTILHERPYFVTNTVIRTDTVRLALVDTSHTTVIRDSADVQIPIERRIYQDSTYRAIVSGYRPSLDSLWIYNTIKEVTITTTVTAPQKKWSFGAALGPSVLVTPKGDVKGGIGVTAGLTYRF